MAPGLALESTAPKSNGLDELLPQDDDLLYEEELLRNPYSLRMWWRYLEARKEAAPRRRSLLFERAIRALPGSYKVNLCSVISGRSTLHVHKAALQVFSLLLQPAQYLTELCLQSFHPHSLCTGHVEYEQQLQSSYTLNSLFLVECFQFYCCGT